MKYVLSACILIALTGAADAQAPGWVPTGEWQCGPHVRIVASTDGRDGIDFFVVGAWFDNHYTLRRGQLFYNGTPCSVLGNPLGVPPPRRQPTTDDETLGGPR
jgi:hypothetical protein